MIRRPPRSTLDRASAASDVYKRQDVESVLLALEIPKANDKSELAAEQMFASLHGILRLSLIHISEPTRPY